MMGNETGGDWLATATFAVWIATIIAALLYML